MEMLILRFAALPLIGVLMLATPQAAAQAAGLAAPAARPPVVQRMLNGVPLTYLHGIGRELADELDLNDAQLETVANIVDRHQQRISEDRRRVRMMRQALRELEDARMTGDEHKSAEIEKRVREIEAERAQAGGPKTDDAQAAFFDDVRAALPVTLTPGVDAFETRLCDRRQLGEKLRLAIEELPKKLELTPDQAARFAELREELRAAAPRQAWTAAQPSPDEVDWLDAGLSADPDAPNAFAPVRTPQANNLAIDRFFDQLSAAVNPAQREKLITLRASTSTHGEPAYVDMRAFFRAIHKLSLTSDQSDKIREIERSSMREHRRAAGDAEARQTVARTAREQVRALLTADQVGELDRLMAEGHPDRPTSRPTAESKP